MDKDIDVQFLCEDCARYDLCEYYHKRKKNSCICKYFHIDEQKALEQEPCEDCISREAVIKHICESKECYKDDCKGRLYKRCYDLQWIYELRKSEQSKTGHWIYGIDEDTGEKDLYAWTCSECGGKYPWQPKYCPNCGAKMESEEKEWWN